MFQITNTLIIVARDCKVDRGIAPPERTPKTIALLQYELLSAHPYRFDINELNFAVHVLRSGITLREVAAGGEALREEFFSSSHPCMRASPLTRTYGWGAHYDARGMIGLYGVESAEYARLSNPLSGMKVEPSMAISRHQ